MRSFLPNSLPGVADLVLLAVNLHGIAVAAPTDAEQAQTIVHMLDYVGVDYPGLCRMAR